MEIKHYIFDYLSTADGYEIGWLHEDTQKTLATLTTNYSMINMG
jgi:hypothetical protein